MKKGTKILFILMSIGLIVFSLFNLIKPIFTRTIILYFLISFSFWIYIGFMGLLFVLLIILSYLSFKSPENKKIIKQINEKKEGEK